jgi:hypothetical protein
MNVPLNLVSSCLLFGKKLPTAEGHPSLFQLVLAAAL